MAAAYLICAVIVLKIEWSGGRLERDSKALLSSPIVLEI